MSKIKGLKLKPIKQSSYVFSKNIEEFSSLQGGSFEYKGKIMNKSNGGTYIYCDSHKDILGKLQRQVIISNEFIKERPKETKIILSICLLNKNTINNNSAENEIKRLIADKLIDSL